MPINVEVKDNAHMSQIAAAHGKRDWTLVWDQCGLKGRHKNPHILFKADQVRVPGGFPPLAAETVSLPDEPPPPTRPAPTKPADKSGRGPSLFGRIGKSKESKAKPAKSATQPAMAEEALIFEDRMKNESGATEMKHSFVVPVFKLKLRLRILDGRHQPLQDAKYKLQLDAGIPLAGSLAPDGSLEVGIPNSAQSGMLTVNWGPPADPSLPPSPQPLPPLRSVFLLEIGKLNPILEPAPDAECITGVQARLNNMGFLCGEVDGVLDPATREAINQFQRRFGMTVTGQSDNALQQKLETLHDRNTPCPPPPRPQPATATGAQGTTGVAPTGDGSTKPADKSFDEAVVPLGRPRPTLVGGGRTAQPRPNNTNGANPQLAQPTDAGGTQPPQTGTPPNQKGTPPAQTGRPADKPTWMK